MPRCVDVTVASRAVPNVGTQPGHECFKFTTKMMRIFVYMSVATRRVSNSATVPSYACLKSKQARCTLMCISISSLVHVLVDARFG